MAVMCRPCHRICSCGTGADADLVCNVLKHDLWYFLAWLYQSARKAKRGKLKGEPKFVVVTPRRPMIARSCSLNIWWINTSGRELGRSKIAARWRAVRIRLLAMKGSFTKALHGKVLVQ